MLEKMVAFFDARLSGYDTHMLGDILGAKEFYPFTAAQLPMEEKLPLYAKLHRALREGGYFILTDYFAGSDEEEAFFQGELLRLKKEQGITADTFYHYDTPLTVSHEIQVLLQGGFSKVTVLNQWGATYTLKAEV